MIYLFITKFHGYMSGKNIFRSKDLDDSLNDLPLIINVSNVNGSYLFNNKRFTKIFCNSKYNLFIYKYTKCIYSSILSNIINYNNNYIITKTVENVTYNYYYGSLDFRFLICLLIQ